MPRLYDRVLATPIEQMEPPYAVNSPKMLGLWRQSVEANKRHMKQCEVIVADTVAKYYYETQCARWNFATDFPNLAPPFKQFWVEHKPPTKIIECNSPSGTVHDHDKYPNYWKTPPFKLWAGMYCFTWDFKETPNNLGYFEDCRWNIGIVPYLFNEDNGALQAEPMALQIGVKEDGSYGGQALNLFSEATTPDTKQLLAEYHAHPSNDNYFHQYLLLMIPTLLAISFMHCRGARLEEIVPDAPLSRKWQKRTGKPLARFHVLEIDPMKKILEQHGGNTGSGFTKALHICRGHFKRYEKNGLFGKYPGMYWWHPQLRGNLRNGIMYKDYDVKPDKPVPSEKNEKRERKVSKRTGLKDWANLILGKENVA